MIVSRRLNRSFRILPLPLGQFTLRQPFRPELLDSSRISALSSGRAMNRVARPRAIMPALDISPLSTDLDRIVYRLDNGSEYGGEFCDRLTRSLAQLFGVAASACSENDRSAFDRILVRITPGATLDARLYLSDRLADSPIPPRGILLALANDIIEVARPILSRSPALDDDDLIEIARHHGHSHMGVIAGRSELTIRVTDILVLRGDDDVRRIVAGNEGAHFSDKSFARLSLQARADTAIEAHLLGRPDLPDMVIRFLVENGSETARGALVGRIRADQPRLNLDCGAVPIRLAEDGWLDPYDFEEAAVVLKRLQEVRHNIDGFLRKLAQIDHFAEIVQVMAAVTGVRLETMKHVLVSLDTEPFAVIARTLELKPGTVREILCTGPWLHRLDERARDTTLTLFRTIDLDEARARLRRWTSNAATASRR
jgi:hypothetical protein